jgi:hypothetical protein
LNLASRIYTYLVLLAGLVIAAGCLVVFPVWGPVSLFMGLTFAVLLALSIRFPLDLQPGVQIQLDTILTFAGLLMFQPFIYLAICGLGVLAGSKKLAGGLSEVIFAVGQKLVIAGIAVLILHVFATAPWSPDSLHAWTGMLAAGVFLPFGGSFLHAGLVSLRDRVPFFPQWFNHIERTSSVQFMLLAVGLLIALVVTPYPWALVLLIIPGAGVSLAFSHQVRLQASHQFLANASARTASELQAQIDHLQEANREMEATCKVNRELRKGAHRQDLPPIILEQVGRLLQAGSGAVVVCEPEGGSLLVEAARGSWSRLAGRRSSQTGAAGQVIQTGQPYLHPDIRRDPEFIGHEQVEGDFAVAGVPLIAQNEVIGVLWAGRSTAFEPRDLRLLATIADSSAAALVRSTSFERVQQTADRMTTLNQDSTAACDAVLEAWAKSLELTDLEARGHTERVCQLAQRLGGAMRLSELDLERLHRGALLHDIGKMSVPDHILTKDTPLNDEEWAIMRRHPQVAYDLLSSIRFLKPALSVPYCHHEKWDGSGYPRGLKGDRIPLAARIFAVVDVWDSLTHDRPYRAAWPAEKALDYIRRQAGAQFDPQVVELFVMLVQQAVPDPQEA